MVLDLLREPCELRHWDVEDPIPRAVLYEWMEDAQGLFCAGRIQVDDDLLSRAPRLRVITQASVGYDNIDVDACTAHGIPFGNTPGVLVEATADLAFGLLLSAARRLHTGWVQVKSGEWGQHHDIPFGHDLFGKTLGIVGMGSIGTAVARRAQASGMHVIYHNRTQRSDDAALHVTYTTFPALLESSDFVLVLVPLTEASRGLFGATEFAQMKSSAYFINVARGLIVDTMALYQALKAGEILYAALDVTDPEPLPADHPLLTLPNILVTPHIGSATHETRDAMARLAVSNLLQGLAGRPLPACVNPAVLQD